MESFSLGFLLDLLGDKGRYLQKKAFNFGCPNQLNGQLGPLFPEVNNHILSVWQKKSLMMIKITGKHANIVNFT